MPTPFWASASIVFVPGSPSATPPTALWKRLTSVVSCRPFEPETPCLACSASKCTAKASAATWVAVFGAGSGRGDGVDGTVSGAVGGVPNLASVSGPTSPSAVRARYFCQLMVEGYGLCTMHQLT